MHDFSNLFPVRKCEFEINNELVTVLFIKEKKSFIEKIIFKNKTQKPNKIDLDKIGSFIWILCDGKNTVANIIEKAGKEFLENEDQMNSRVEIFINQLNKNHLITLYQKEADNK
ncbi:MAG: PqqD family protein [Melioribacteraceae bacterium]|nr:PqqD family protein [Melioribacteraceae bacterium]